VDGFRLSGDCFLIVAIRIAFPQHVNALDAVHQLGHRFVDGHAPEHTDVFAPAAAIAVGRALL